MRESPLLERGVYSARYEGPNGELVLLAVTSRGRLATGAPILVPAGARATTYEEAWDTLDRVDPIAQPPAKPARSVRRGLLTLVGGAT